MLLKTNNLTMVYDQGKEKVQALTNIDIDIAKGSFTFIVGKSGSGKTTLLHNLAGLLPPTKGAVLMDNQSIYELSDSKRAKNRRMNVGFIFQFFNLFPELTINENIRIMTKINKMKTDETYFNDIVEFLELDGLLKNYPSTLSGGQQQRVAIARALIHKPMIVFADEPTGNLDQETSYDVVELLEKVKKEFKQTIILVTHDLDLVKHGDRVITLRDGFIINDVKQLQNSVID